MLRVITGLTISCGITFGLFVLMAYLVEVDDEGRKDEIEDPIVVIIADVRDDTELTQIDRILPEPKEVEELPKIDTLVTETETNDIKDLIDIDIKVATLGPGVGIGIGPGPGQNHVDGDAVPVFTISPQFPSQQARMGQEGWVKVAFDINPDGTVSNARVVDAEPRRVFDRAALRAIRKWKFKPKMVDGRAVVQNNKTYVIDFNLND